MHSARPHPHDAVKVKHVALGLADGLPPLEAAPVRQALRRLIARLEVRDTLSDVSGCLQQLHMSPHAVQIRRLCSWQEGTLRVRSPQRGSPDDTKEILWQPTLLTWSLAPCICMHALFPSNLSSTAFYLALHLESEHCTNHDQPPHLS